MARQIEFAVFCRLACLFLFLLQSLLGKTITKGSDDNLSIDFESRLLVQSSY